MKITTKINVITTAWLLLILIAINSIVFLSFMTITFNLVQNEVQQKSSDIIKVMKKNDEQGSLNDKLLPYLASHGFIRIIDDQGHVQTQVSNDQYLLKKIDPEFLRKEKTTKRIIRPHGGEEQIIIYQHPISNSGKVTGTLEIAERVPGLELGKDVLLGILSFCTLLGAVLSLLGGKWLSNIIIRPISNIIGSMEEIEQSGVPKKIVIQRETKDELNKLAVTFNRMIDRLDVTLEQQKQFISDASHELKTPLTVIKSYADLLRRRGIQNVDMTLEAIESIHSEATRIQKMTERFLDLAKTEVDEDLDFKLIPLTEFCQRIIQQLEVAYSRKLKFHTENNKIAVLADELKLKQVIIIIVDNALKYSKEQVEIFVEENARHVIIRVVDYGIGIPADDTDSIFERFYRVDKARSRETGGMGLGLPIAKNIMKQHHGEIKLRSKEGQGTEVALLLPKESKAT
ncbi:sensor histidine kinase [Priestia koreensis]|uniref:sensor histidine kinase n=1 Tax=Priestia koreensis TaxID=284581 RepID=UPI003459D7F1